MNKGMLTSNRQDWETPPELFNRLDAIFHFTLDACAVQSNAKCARYFSPGEDGLSKSWVGETVWCNPPYGREIGAWIQKAYEESKRACVVMLLPARTDTAWFHDYCAKGEITFLRGRLRIGGMDSNAPFPSMIVIFDRRYQYGLPELGT